MAICEKCKWRVVSTIHVMGYGDLPEFRCTRNPATGKAWAGGKSVPCQGARRDSKATNAAKVGKGLKCDNFRPATAQGGGG